MMLNPKLQKDLGNLINLDIHEAERFWRKEAHAMARGYFEAMATSPQTPQELAEIGPMLLAVCAEMAAPPVAPKRLLRVQHASRAAFYERLRVLLHFADDTVSPGRVAG
ncbi:hypothetical protein [Mesorhizobium jarvisii]|uniref:hypothetical protein n=1 Tax=Mesorhizobium jarvisii TaxID=1777867 RepID=UPI001F0AC574|nr:hypothetical protein [Mesorhizobium jarvisii]MCH4554858.1 hypothetical protein [Mesorhizobium jarvisii]